MRSIDTLVRELRRAHEEAARKKTAWEEGKLAVSKLREEYSKALKAKEAIDLEIVTGKSAAPLLDAIESSNDTADEHQRGPTVREPRIADHQAVPTAPRKRGRPHKLQAAERVESAKGVIGHAPGCEFEALLATPTRLVYEIHDAKGRVCGTQIAATPDEAVRDAEASPLWLQRPRPFHVSATGPRPIGEPIGPPHKLQAAERPELATKSPETLGDMEEMTSEEWEDWNYPPGFSDTEPDQVDRADEAPSALQWTSADLERELGFACKIRGIPSDDGKKTVWPFVGLIKSGCDDNKILEVLRAIWPVGYEAIRGNGPWSKLVGCTVHGGPTPAFWIGARKSTDWKIAPPQLQGLQLADRVRAVLGIPRVRIQPEPETAADRQPARRQRRKA